MNVLIVDDDLPTAYLVAATLRTLAERIEITDSFKGAKDWVGREKFDLVLLDLGLPDSMAQQTIDRVHELKESGAKVVILTGAWPTTSRPQPERAEADGILYKGDLKLSDKLKAWILPKRGTGPSFILGFLG